jgi:hypothetical protein
MKIQRFPTGAKATSLAGISRLHQGKGIYFCFGLLFLFTTFCTLALA